MIRKLAYLLSVVLTRILVRPRHRTHYRLTILKLDRLGDAVLSLGAVRELTSSFGEEQTLLIVSSSAAKLYRHEFPMAKVLEMPAFCLRFWPDYWRIISRYAHVLRGISTDDFVCLRHQHSDYLHTVARLINAGRCHASKWEGNPERIGLSFPRCSLTPYPEKSNAGCLEIEAHRRLVGRVLGKCDLERVLPVFTEVRSVPGEGLLVCPVAGDPIRQYPAGLLAEAIRLFLERSPNTSVRFCLPPGACREPWLAAMTSKELGSVNWIVPQDEMALARVIAESRLILAPDSAPAQIATALDKPGVFLLGGGHYGMFAPWHRSERQKWLSHAMDCYHCQWRCPHAEAYCVTRIAPDDVARTLWALEETLPALAAS